MKSREKLSRQSIGVFIHSIRFRLVVWFVLTLGVIMVTFSAFIYWREVQDVRSIALGQLSVILDRTLGRPHENEHYQDQSPVELSGVPADLSNSNPLEVGVVALQSADGSILQSAGVLTPGQIAQLKLPALGWKGVQQVSLPKSAATAGGYPYLFINPVVLQNGVMTGYLLVGVPFDANDQLGRLLVTLAIGNILMLGIALTGGFWLADRALRPVHTITQTARQIGETDLSRRLHLRGQDEISELGNTFDAMLDRLQAAFDRQRQFTADASHELRTPLTIIDLETTRMLANRHSVEDYERVIQTIKSENKAMIRLVTNLLTLARMDAGQMSLKTDPLDLSQLVSEIIERMEPLAKAQGVKLVIGDLPETTIHGDHTTLTQMLTNLVENAIKYSAGVTEPQVDISVGKHEEDHQSLAWVSVRDNGIGIPPEHLTRLFDRFYQVDQSRAHAESTEGETSAAESSGTGLGLAIAQWIARAHNGEIRVESNVGQGSTFEVILPAEDTTHLS